MKPQMRWVHALIVVTLIGSACSSTEAEPAPTTAAATTTAAPTSTAVAETPTTAVAADASDLEEARFDIDVGMTTLLVYAGDVRASRDGAETWFYADSGLWLEAGDRIQVADGGIALIRFPDGTGVRLEGFTDFELVRNEFDFAAGSKRVVGRVLDGAALVSTTPLPTPDSLFQIWSMTCLVDLPYDADHNVALADVATVPEADRLTFGVVMREDAGGETLINYAGSVLPVFYCLEIIDGEDVVLIATTPDSEGFAQYDVPFRDELGEEFTLEGMLDIAAGLVDLSRSAGFEDLDFYGFSMIEEGRLSDNQILYSVFDVADLAEYLAEADDPTVRQEFVNQVKKSRAFLRHRVTFSGTYRIPDIFSPWILMLVGANNLGCDITTGLGCAIPDGCNRDTGEGCAFVSGCNIITRAGCAEARIRCVSWFTTGVVTPGSEGSYCIPQVRTYCDPNVAGDCDQYLASSIPISLAQDPARAGEPLMDANDPTTCTPYIDPDFWQAQVAAAGGGFDDDDEDIEWCTCRAAVPPGWPPPPPWMDMTYRCWCTDPGAY